MVVGSLAIASSRPNTDLWDLRQAPQATAPFNEALKPQWARGQMPNWPNMETSESAGVRHQTPRILTTRRPTYEHDTRCSCELSLLRLT
jgi:hypothetical protein